MKSYMGPSTVFRAVEGQRIEVMRDVGRWQAEGDGYRYIDLFGRCDPVQGRIACLARSTSTSWCSKKHNPHAGREGATPWD